VCGTWSIKHEWSNTKATKTAVCVCVCGVCVYVRVWCVCVCVCVCVQCVRETQKHNAYTDKNQIITE
jgi:hypothetical protein